MEVFIGILLLAKVAAWIGQLGTELGEEVRGEYISSPSATSSKPAGAFVNWNEAGTKRESSWHDFRTTIRSVTVAQNTPSTQRR
jgi:hypothetical protein